MSFSRFLIDKIMFVLLNVVLCFLLSCFLLFIGNEMNEVFLIIIFWVFIFVIYLLFTYFKDKKRFNRLMKIVDSLDHKYLIAEIMAKPEKNSELIYYNILKKATKSMNDEIGQVRRSQNDYREYIEEWVHEIKTPITSSLLICENAEFNRSKELRRELDKINALVTQTLFYARSEVAEKDYFVKETDLSEIIHNNILKYRGSIMSHNLKINIHDTDKMVYTDEKWLDFVLDQIIVNAIKYSKENGHIDITAKEDNGVYLTIYDDGVGISQADLPRIFEKGFTGSNRSEKRSTGIGLYLAKKLCGKLGHKIFADSEDGKYTRITIFFPKGKLNKF